MFKDINNKPKKRKVEIREGGKFFFEVKNRTTLKNINQIKSILKDEDKAISDIDLVEFEILVEQYDDEFDIYINEYNFRTKELIEADRFVKTYKTKRGAKNRVKKLAKKYGCDVEFRLME